MLAYLLRRLVMSATVLLLLLVLLAALVHLVPGDPVTILIGPIASEGFVEKVRVEMGLDQPILEQIWTFVVHALGGDLGRDFSNRRPVTRLVGDVLPHTAVLAASGLLIATLIGVPLGVAAATRPNSWADRLIATVSIAFITLPQYVVGLFLLLALSLYLPLFPAVGAGSFADPIDYAHRLVLPALALALGWIGYLARLVRASMLEVLQANYIRTARALGLSPGTIYYRYALKTAIVPTVAVLGTGLGHLLGGAIFIEVIFSRPGLGKLLYDAIATRNYPVMRGAVIAVALLFIATNLVADLIYRFLDPRMRVEDASA